MNNQTIAVTLEKDAWNKLQTVSQFVMIPLKKQAEMMLTLKLSKELPAQEKSYLIAETEAIPENFSLLMRSVFRRLLKFGKDEVRSSEAKSNDEVKDQTFEIEISEHQFQKLNDFAAANNSDVSNEVSRMLREYLKETYADIGDDGKQILN